MPKVKAQARKAASPSTDVPPILAQRAYEKIIEAIRLEKLKPGDLIRERQAAEWLEMSRTPVRHALFRLESEGFLTNDPHLGLKITEVNLGTLTEIYILREHLGGLVGRLAARTIQDADIRALQHMIEIEGRLPFDVAAIENHNMAFHAFIYRLTHNRFLQKVMKTHDDFFVLLGRHINTKTEKRRKAAFREHVKIVGALAARDPDAAERAFKEHFEASYRERVRTMSEPKRPRPGEKSGKTVSSRILSDV